MSTWIQILGMVIITFIDTPMAHAVTFGKTAVAQCGYCKKESAELRCGQCRFISYCGKDCQKNAWPAHKAYCKSLKEMVSSAALHGQCTLHADLHQAVKKGCVSCLQLLLASGAVVDSNNAFGWSPLHTAAAYGQASCLKVLLENKATIDNNNNKTCSTPLHYAAWNNQVACIQSLVLYGADTALKTQSGKTAEDEATNRADYHKAEAEGKAERAAVVAVRKKMIAQVLDKQGVIKDLIDLIISCDVQEVTFTTRLAAYKQLITEVLNGAVKEDVKDLVNVIAAYDSPA